jgi:hypothetical protein
MVLARVLLGGVLTLSVVSLSGCLDTLAEAVLAPESLAVQGASGGVQALGSNTDSPLSSLNDLSSTASEIDHLLANYPDAANRGELSSLRSQLNGGQVSKPPVQQGSITNDKERMSDFDRRLEISTSDRRTTSDTMVIKPRLILRRPGDQLQITIEPTALDHWRIPTYMLQPWQTTLH